MSKGICGDEYGFHTRAVHTGNDVDAETGAIRRPITMANGYELPYDPTDMNWSSADGNLYTRNDGANQKYLQEKPSSLEGGEDCVVLASGVAALFGGKTGGKSRVIREGGSLSIPTAEVTETASFYPVEVDGVTMEVLANGSIRTAFNICQSCYVSGKGYYKPDGTELVCQNCGFRFTAEQVQVTSGGCSPWPIFA